MAIYYDPMFFEHVEIWEARNIPFVAKHETTNFRLFGDFDIVTNEKPENVENCVTVSTDMLNAWKEKAIQTRMQDRADNREQIEQQRIKDGAVPRIEPDAVARLTQKADGKPDGAESKPNGDDHKGRPGTARFDNDSLSTDVIVPDESEVIISSDG